jgi:hypothetical protein
MAPSIITDESSSDGSHDAQGTHSQRRRQPRGNLPHAHTMQAQTSGPTGATVKAMRTLNRAPTSQPRSAAVAIRRPERRCTPRFQSGPVPSRLQTNTTTGRGWTPAASATTGIQCSSSTRRRTSCKRECARTARQGSGATGSSLLTESNSARSCATRRYALRDGASVRFLPASLAE